ncbi:MAG: tetratricopeptide repeat protein [Saprospiraceae bacterium]
MKHICNFLFLAILILACNQETDTEKAARLTQQLVDLDKAMGGVNVTDKEKAKEFIATSEQLATLVEKDNLEKYADVILKAAGLAKTIGLPEKSIELYRKVAEGAPDNKKAPTALFMIGFVYENDLNDLEKAKQVYETFLDKYPNDPDFADDAQMALKNLGKSPEELIKEFEQNQPAQ